MAGSLHPGEEHYIPILLSQDLKKWKQGTYITLKGLRKYLGSFFGFLRSFFSVNAHAPDVKLKHFLTRNFSRKSWKLKCTHLWTPTRHTERRSFFREHDKKCSEVREKEGKSNIGSPSLSPRSRVQFNQSFRLQLPFLPFFYCQAVKPFSYNL